MLIFTQVARRKRAKNFYKGPLMLFFRVTKIWRSPLKLQEILGSTGGLVTKFWRFNNMYVWDFFVFLVFVVQFVKFLERTKNLKKLRKNQKTPKIKTENGFLGGFDKFYYTKIEKPHKQSQRTKRKTKK